MADDLTSPLGLPTPRKSRKRPPLIALLAPVAAICVAAALVFVSRLGEREEPAVIAKIAGADPTVTGTVAKPGPVTVDTAGPGLTEVAPAGTLADIGKSSGDVVVRDPSASTATPVRLAAVPREDLVEKTRYGLIPKVGEDGTRPIDAYASPSPDAKPGMYRVAIVVGGFGLTESDTASLDGLPGPVTLGIAPYGSDLPQTLADARAAGHEILLQVPLEPYGYPDVDPGPKTLTVDANTKENLDRLHWLMSRLTTYVGVVNYMGARFTADADKMAPFLAEIGNRGLLYLDDGSSSRSTAAEAAGDAIPFLHADVVLDADTDPAAIDQRLDQLAAIAREHGSAIATGSAFPVTIKRIAAFAKTAAEHGIVIVPVSALLPART